MKLSFVIFSLLYIILCITSSSSDANVAAQVSLPIDEVNSALYLLQLYGKGGENSTTLCNSESSFKCTTTPDSGDGLYHINSISLVVGPDAVWVSQPNQTLSELVFPSVTSIYIQDSTNPLTNTSTNILLLLKNLPVCGRLSVLYDRRITTIPSTFSTAFPVLTNIYLARSPITSIPVFFNISTLIAIDLIESTVSEIGLSPTTNLPLLESLSIGFQCDNDMSLTFSETSFPVLKAIGLISIGGTKTVTADIQKPVTSLTIRGPGKIVPTLKFPQDLAALEFNKTPFSMIPSDFNLFTRMFSLMISNTPLNSLPMDSLLPRCTYAAFVNSSLTSLPPLLVNNSSPQLALSLQDNTALQGTLSQKYCNIGSLNITNTAISSIPDCFWCWATPQILQKSTSLVEPPSVNCTVQIDSFNLISRSGFFTITGNNLGWASSSSLYDNVIPNKVVRGQIPLSSLVQSLYHTQYVVFGKNAPHQSSNYTFTITEVEFNVNSSYFSKQNIFSVELSIKFDYINTDYPITSVNIDGLPCAITNFDNTTKTLTCISNVPTSKTPLVSIVNIYKTAYVFPSLNRAIVVSSAELIPQSTYPPTDLILNGYFGSSTQNGYIVLNETTSPYYCNITFYSSSSVQCKFQKQPPSGPTQLSVITPSDGSFISNTLLSIPYPPPSDCAERTNNCNGHGICINGACQCDPGWVDDCSIYVNSTIPDNVAFKPNQTDPTPSFSYKDYVFSFQMVAIQELNVDGLIIQEIITNNWTVEDKSSSDLTKFHYELVSHQQFNQTNNNNTTTSSSISLLNVTSLVEFSNNSRSVNFGPDTLELLPRSIKISVNVTNWPFQSTLSNLRIIFSTITNNEQSKVGCDGTVNQIDTFQQFSNVDSIQYLRVVKDNIQFFGRFLDYSISDERKTYSKTQVLNVTKSLTNDQESITLIAIGLPQCRECLLDPDFSAILIDRDTFNGTCDGGDSGNKWKIIVGVIVGVVGAVCLAIIIYALAKRLKVYLILNSKSVKMNEMN